MTVQNAARFWSAVAPEPPLFDFTIYDIRIPIVDIPRTTTVTGLEVRRFLWASLPSTENTWEPGVRLVVVS